MEETVAGSDVTRFHLQVAVSLAVVTPVKTGPEIPAEPGFRLAPK
jgi:hypothetical protein